VTEAPQSELLTSRLRLSPLNERDIDVLHAIWTEPGVRRFLWDDRRLSRHETRDFVARSSYLLPTEGVGLWLAREGGGEGVGFGGFWSLEGSGDLELIYGVRDTKLGQGYGREIVRPLLRYGFEQLGLEDIRASTDVPNTASVRLLKSFGFLQFQRLGDSVRFRLPRGVYTGRAVA
jgi:[ribosomal protein S5]-alanine N-acetyltransferase